MRARTEAAARPSEAFVPQEDVLDRALRADLAQHYLKDPSVSISQIAWLVGFQEVPAFTTAFKRRTRVTPAQMRTSKGSRG